MGNLSAEGMVQPPQEQIKEGKGITRGREEIARFLLWKATTVPEQQVVEKSV
jgi:hypothetical protein